MRDTQLADCCAVSEFTTKVNSLVKDHAPYMTNDFKDQTAMNKFIVRLMPYMLRQTSSPVFAS